MKRKRQTKGIICVLHVSTWHKDSFGLYDYQSQSPQEKFEIIQSSKIFRDPNYKTKNISLEDVKFGLLPSPQYSLFASINLKQEGKYYFSKPNNQTPAPSQYVQQPNDIYLSLRAHQKTKGHQIRIMISQVEQGDVVKFGRLVFSVMQINNSLKGSEQINNYQTRFFDDKETYFQEKQINGSCKICLGQETNDLNFMVSPCKCKGSCEMVHLECLKSWIQSKVKKELQGVVMTYNFTKFHCEICKTGFPKVIVYKDKRYFMFKIDKPKKPYILLQNLGSNGESNSIHMVTLNELQILRIGRSQQNQLKLSDISVSRNHAELQYIQGKYYLRDLKSKFGTLILLKNEVQIKNDTTFQAGRTIYSFKFQNSGYPRSIAFIRNI